MKDPTVTRPKIVDTESGGRAAAGDRVGAGPGACEAPVPASNPAAINTARTLKELTEKAMFELKEGKKIEAEKQYRRRVEMGIKGQQERGLYRNWRERVNLFN